MSGEPVLTVDPDLTRRQGMFVHNLQPLHHLAVEDMGQIFPDCGDFREAVLLKEKITECAKVYSGRMQDLERGCIALAQMLQDIASGYVDLELKNTESAGRADQAPPAGPVRKTYDEAVGNVHSVARLPAAPAASG